MEGKIQAQPHPNPAITFSSEYLLLCQEDMCGACTSSILPNNNKWIVEKNSHSKPEGAFPKREVSKSATAPILTSRTNPGHVIMPNLSLNLYAANYLIMHSIGTHPSLCIIKYYPLCVLAEERQIIISSCIMK